MPAVEILMEARQHGFQAERSHFETQLQSQMQILEDKVQRKLPGFDRKLESVQSTM